jgi:competence protein ComEC
MRHFKKNFKYWFIIFLLVCVVFVWYAVFKETREGILVAFLDIGQGDAIFIEAPNGNQVLLDGGSDKSIIYELSSVMPFYDRSIDVVIQSHPDADHIGGLIDVLKRYHVGIVIEPGAVSESVVYKEFKDLVDKKEIKSILAKRGMKIDLGEGAYIFVLFPDRDVSGLDSNDASIVAKLVYGKTEFLLTGDSPKSIESYLCLNML